MLIRRQPGRGGGDKVKVAQRIAPDLLVALLEAAGRDQLLDAGASRPSFAQDFGHGRRRRHLGDPAQDFRGPGIAAPLLQRLRDAVRIRLKHDQVLLTALGRLNKDQAFVNQPVEWRASFGAHQLEGIAHAEGIFVAPGDFVQQVGVPHRFAEPPGKLRDLLQCVLWIESRYCLCPGRRRRQHRFDRDHAGFRQLIELSFQRLLSEGPL